MRRQSGPDLKRPQQGHARLPGQSAPLAVGRPLRGFGSSVVILDLLMKLDVGARVFTLDTGRLSPETYDLIDRCVRRYGTKLEFYFPAADETEAMVMSHGINLFYDSVELRQTCCRTRKLLPLKRALSGLSAWITGLRRGQSAERGNIEMLEVDAEHGSILKINPLAHWSEDAVWRYVREYDVPYNALYNHGYTSIGCAPCTRATSKGEDLRAGRW